jgi:PhzF family phenazine biosynthesis protein
MNTVEVVLVDAFTSAPFAGNPAAVVPDATGLDDAQMRAIAGEMARPATAFVLPAAARGERGLRWFSPAGVELTLCGHGTVAAAHVLAARGEVPDGRLVFRSPRHRLAIAFEGSGASRLAWFEPDCPRWAPEHGDLAPFLAALGLPAGAVAPWAPPARTSEQDLLIPVAGLEALRTLAPDLAALARLARDRGVRAVVLTAGPSPTAATSSRTSGSRRTPRPGPRTPRSASGSGRPVGSSPRTASHGSGGSRATSTAGPAASPSRCTASPAGPRVPASAVRPSSCCPACCPCRRWALRGP